LSEEVVPQRESRDHTGPKQGASAGGSDRDHAGGDDEADESWSGFRDSDSPLEGSRKPRLPEAQARQNRRDAAEDQADFKDSDESVTDESTVEGALFECQQEL